jgi:DNA-binding LacI/PurR family transcriptional regulator
MSQTDHTNAKHVATRVKMTDIARLSGVSTSTVSRALKNSPLIPQETRQRIQELAKNMNYAVNVGAANLRLNAVNTVAMVHLGDGLRRVSDPFLLSMIGGVADQLEAAGMNLLITRLDDQRADQVAAMVSSGQVAGLLFIGQQGWHNYLNHLAHRQIPIAVWGASLPDADYRVVGTNNLEGGFKATQHLIQQGCRKIAFVGDINFPEGKLRYQGYLKAMAASGLHPDPLLLHPFIFGEESTRFAVQTWVKNQNNFDGVFACSDVAAINIISTLKVMGINVPQDVKVVGYDDIPMASYIHPALTTIRQPLQDAAKHLVELLTEAMSGLARRNILLETQLITRQSTQA